MIQEFYLYQLDRTATGIFDSFLGGIYLIKGVPILLQLAVLSFYLIAFGLIACSQPVPQDEEKRWLRLSKFCALIAFSLSCLLMFNPWDESFINLRHAFNLAHSNFFTFNLSHPSEGTADFLVFASLGLLGKIKLPFLELLLLQSWLGGLLCLLAIERIAIELEISSAKKWGFLVGSFFPTLLLNSSLGFATTLFAAAILWAIHYTFIQPRWRKSMVILALIPLLRWEGFWFSSLCCLTYVKYPSFSRLKRRLLIPVILTVFTPTLLLTLYRFRVFSSGIPVPVLYKNSLGNPFYFFLGLRNLFLDLTSTLSLAFLLIWALFLTFEKENLRKLPVLNVILVILLASVVPYYLSGGDWFPASCGRYLLPLTLFLIPSTWKLLSSLSTQRKKSFLVVFVISLFICGSNPGSSVVRMYQLLFSHGSALLSLNLKKRIENPTYRIHYLSQLGIHLKKTTEPKDKIGTSELATINYFSERDAVDFLGLTDLELAKLPVREAPLLFRKNPKAPELPVLIFKRLAPKRLGEKLPEYLYLFDFMIEILMDQKTTEDWTDADYLRAIHRWQSKFKGLINPLYGGIDHVLDLGYVPVIINYENDFCALYFVRRNKMADHNSKLQNLGFSSKLIQARGLK
jgi:hypothetical protein